MYSSLEPVVKIKGTVIDLAEYSAYRYGYTFDGWYADEALTQRVTSVTLDADKTVYAAWTRNRFFEDVTIADWFYDDVMFVCGRGVMQGVSDTRFGPHLTATRAMMATILWRMEGSPAPTAEARFTDVRSGQWYSEAVAWTAQSGVYTGSADGSFRPTDSITREQLAAILYRYAKYKGVDVSVGEDTNILSYADAAEISDYAFPAMQWGLRSRRHAGLERQPPAARSSDPRTDCSDAAPVSCKITPLLPCGQARFVPARRLFMNCSQLSRILTKPAA